MLRSLLHLIWSPLHLSRAGHSLSFPRRRASFILPLTQMEPIGRKQVLPAATAADRLEQAPRDEPITQQQDDTKKKMKGGVKRRRKKSASSDSLNSSLAELPFVNADIGDAFGNEPITQQQDDTKKKMKRDEKRRRKKSASSDSLNSSLAELPFVNADIGEALGITATSDKGHLKKKRKRAVELENEDKDPKKKKKQTKPNYFISVPITNQKILDNIQTLQDTVVQKEHRLSKAMVPQGTFHLTLFVMHLSSEEEIALAVCALTETKSLVEELLHGRPMVLSFQGISDFRNAVVFVRLAEGDPAAATLTMITKTMMKLFKEKGILIGANNAFTPHLTFMKLSRSPKLHKQGLKKIDPSLYEDFKNHYFGDEILNNLDLCSMLKKKQPGGYFHCEYSITVGGKSRREPDDAELVSLSKRLVENAILKAVQQYLEESQNKSRHTEGSTAATTSSDRHGNSGDRRK
ncbi:A-kinase anchoring protein 7 isoform X2 [Rhinatrema bivittatum]|uniref:A-kinase anchoring protein 7 isoform X2 n=1 Tax=Rhinatrema bivittatum TaxID=194408 RepID=UPI001126EF6B|nr:A-kinase anchoring protein 7 isoform X2 [Rhinatrema bivittatum]